MKKELESILAKEVDRRDFLKHVGVTLLALTGVAATAKTLSSFGSKQQAHGYNAGAYGGDKNPS